MLLSVLSLWLVRAWPVSSGQDCFGKGLHTNILSQILSHIYLSKKLELAKGYRDLFNLFASPPQCKVCPLKSFCIVPLWMQPPLDKEIWILNVHVLILMCCKYVLIFMC